MCVPKEQDEQMMPPLVTPGAWEPWAQPIGPPPFSVVGRYVCREPLTGLTTNPLKGDPTPGTEGKRTA